MKSYLERHIELNLQYANEQEKLYFEELESLNKSDFIANFISIASKIDLGKKEKLIKVILILGEKIKRNIITEKDLKLLFDSIICKGEYFGVHLVRLLFKEIVEFIETKQDI
jgi:hypothetical protein